MFGHVISTVLPAVIREFAEDRDAAVVRCFETIQHHEVSESSTHALPVGAGGAALHPLVHHGGGIHLGTYYRVAGPSLPCLFSWAVLPRGKWRLSYLTHQGRGLKEDGQHTSLRQISRQLSSMSPSPPTTYRRPSSLPPDVRDRKGYLKHHLSFPVLKL